MAVPETGIQYVVELDTTGGGNWIAVAHQRGGSLPLDRDAIDATSKDDNAWGKTLAGRRNWSIDVDGLIVTDNAAYLEMVDNFQNDTGALPIRITRSDGNVFQGSANLTSFSHEFPYDDVASYSATFAGEGAPTKFWEAP